MTRGDRAGLEVPEPRPARDDGHLDRREPRAELLADRLCRMVLRSTAQMTSAQPATARSTRATQSTLESPKPAIASPQTATAMTTARPRRRTAATQPVVNAPRSAPDARRGEEQPDDRGAGVEPLRREGGEEGRGHAEDHRVEVKQVDPLEDLAAPQVREALADRARARAAARPPIGGSGDIASVAAKIARKLTASSAVGEREADRASDAAEHRPDDRRELDGDLVERVRARSAGRPRRAAGSPRCAQGWRTPRAPRRAP